MHVQLESDEHVILTDSISTDVSTLKRLFSCFPSGVTGLCATVGGVPVGMAASAFTFASLEPPIGTVCIQQTSSTWPLLRSVPRLGLSILSSRHETICRDLASKDGDRFRNASWKATDSGAVLLEQSSAAMECSIEREIEAGDHVVVLLNIHAITFNPEADPLVFQGSRFRQLLKA